MWWNRSDGELVRDADAERRIMPYIMRGRNESVAYFESVVDVSRTSTFLHEFNRRRPDDPATLFHVVLWAITRTLDEYPHLNRFVAGGRLYQRDGIWISFAAKKEMVEQAPLVTVKRRFDPAQDFPNMVTDVRSAVEAARGGEDSAIDRELALLLRLPGTARRAAASIIRFADRLGALPSSFIEPDPMFASVWMANLGSLKMDPVFHHLYEYGNAGVFCTVGRIRSEPVIRSGAVVAGEVARLKFSYDERIDDGMYAGHAERLLRHLVEDPAGHGCGLPSTGLAAAS